METMFLQNFGIYLQVHTGENHEEYHPRHRKKLKSITAKPMYTTGIKAPVRNYIFHI